MQEKGDRMEPESIYRNLARVLAGSMVHRQIAAIS
jgi:hypothetical protein